MSYGDYMGMIWGLYFLVPVRVWRCLGFRVYPGFRETLWAEGWTVGCVFLFGASTLVWGSVELHCNYLPGPPPCKNGGIRFRGL